jgi:membrane protease YdiL (CAAX protease family)
LTTPLDIYAAAGGERPGFWRMFVGIALIVAGWLVWVVVIMSCFVVIKIANGLGVREALDSLSLFLNAESANSVLFKLSTFIGVWPAAWVVMKVLHGTPFGALLSPERRMRWGDFGRGLLLAVGFWALTLAFSVPVGGFPERSTVEFATWTTIIVPLAVLVFFQASAEELIFRGYILQQLAVRWRSPLIWGALPAFLFGLAHYDNGAALGAGWLYVTATLLFGLTAAALVWRTGSLAAAMGLHTGLNIFSLSGIGLEGVVEGTQLYLYDGAGAKELLMADCAATLALFLFIVSPLCRLRTRPILG